MSLDEEYLQNVLRTISHDMGGALRASVGFSTLLLDNYADSLDDKAIMWLSLIQSEGQKAQSQLSALSRYARLYSIDEAPSDCDLSELCQQAIGTLPVSVLSSDLSLVVGSLPVIKGFDVLWVNLFAELINNTAKYAWGSSMRASGKVECRIFSEVTADAVTIVVEDTGVGMSAKQVAMALQPFRRVVAGSDTSIGAGMGLSIVKRIAELHQGAFLLESGGNNKGIRASIQLPSQCLISSGDLSENAL